MEILSVFAIPRISTCSVMILKTEHVPYVGSVVNIVHCQLIPKTFL